MASATEKSPPGFHSPGNEGKYVDEKVEAGGANEDQEGLALLGYEQGLQRNRSMFTLLFQAISIAAIPYGEGSPLISAIYGGGPLAIFVGWIVVCFLDECIAFSLAEIASRYPTSAGVYYWSYQLSNTKSQAIFFSFLTGWIWLIGNWTITLSVNFGFANLISGTVAMYHPEWEPNTWQLLLIFYALTLMTFAICSLGSRLLVNVDILCAYWTLISVAVICIALSVEANAGRHSAAYALGHFNPNLSGWGNFGFFIGLLPPAYTFSAIGMVSSMAEELNDPAARMPRVLVYTIPVCGIGGLFYILPICFTLPKLAPILEAPVAQALPYIFNIVMGSPGGALGLMFLIFGITMFCSVSVTNAATRTTWAFARDKGIPFHSLWSRVNQRLSVPFWSLVLITVVQMLLGLIYLGSSSAFTAFISVGVFGLAMSYAIPIALSMLDGRRQIQKAKWKVPNSIGFVLNTIAVLWILFELVLFSMPTALPVTKSSMNYASVVFAGFFVLSIIYWFIGARTVYKGPPKSDAL